jgi:hypothetical protein
MPKKDPAEDTLRLRSALFSDPDWERVVRAAKKVDRSAASLMRVATLKNVAEIEAQFPQTQPQPNAE